MDQLNPDEEFFSKLPPAVRQIAERHGRGLFEFALNLLTINECVKTVSALLPKGRGGKMALLQLIQASNRLAGMRIAAEGWTAAQLMECETDIARLGALGFATELETPDEGIIVRH